MKARQAALPSLKAAIDLAHVRSLFSGIRDSRPRQTKLALAANFAVTFTPAAGL
jgi:hypothetical protein